jgi:hypothetical protein
MASLASYLPYNLSFLAFLVKMSCLKKVYLNL